MSDTASERAEALRADSDASRITHPQVQEERMSGSKNGELRSSDTLHNSTSSDRAPPPHVSPVKDKSSQPPLVNTDSKQPPRGRPLKALGHADAFPFQGAPVDGVSQRTDAGVPTCLLLPITERHIQAILCKSGSLISLPQYRTACVCIMS